MSWKPFSELLDDLYRDFRNSTLYNMRRVLAESKAFTEFEKEEIIKMLDEAVAMRDSEENERYLDCEGWTFSAVNQETLNATLRREGYPGKLGDNFGPYYTFRKMK